MELQVAMCLSSISIHFIPWEWLLEWISWSILVWSDIVSVFVCGIWYLTWYPGILAVRVELVKRAGNG